MATDSYIHFLCTVHHYNQFYIYLSVLLFHSLKAKLKHLANGILIIVQFFLQLNVCFVVVYYWICLFWRLSRVFKIIAQFIIWLSHFFTSMTLISRLCVVHTICSRWFFVQETFLYDCFLSSVSVLYPSDNFLITKIPTIKML